MNIQILKKEDLQGLKRLYEEGFGIESSNFQKMLDYFEKINNNPDYIILCAYSDKELTGSVQGVVCYELFGQCKPFMVVENVVVLPSHRRQGIAKKLLIELEKQARTHKCSAILFVSSSHRSGAHKLYESLGFGEDKVNGYRKKLIYT